MFNIARAKWFRLGTFGFENEKAPVILLILL